MVHYHRADSRLFLAMRAEPMTFSNGKAEESQINRMYITEGRVAHQVPGLSRNVSRVHDERSRSFNIL
jgi:hypothetical protein